MASEEVNERNILAVKAHSEYTRTMVRALETEVAALKNTIGNLDSKVTALQNQVNTLLVKVYSGGQLSADNTETSKRV